MKIDRAIRIYDIPENRKMDFNNNIVSITEKMVAQQVEKMDDFICESIIKCLPQDVTKVLFLDKNKIVEIFKNQQNGGWIPVSERLPSEEECNRFDIRHPNRRKFLCAVKIGDYEPQVRELCFSIFYQWEYYSENYTKYVIAWQPLPEPYKEVEQ